MQLCSRDRLFEQLLGGELEVILRREEFHSFRGSCSSGVYCVILFLIVTMSCSSCTSDSSRGSGEMVVVAARLSELLGQEATQGLSLRTEL